MQKVPSFDQYLSTFTAVSKVFASLPHNQDHKLTLMISYIRYDFARQHRIREEGWPSICGMS